MDDVTQNEFFPALEKVVTGFGGIYHKQFYNESYVRAVHWPMFPRELQTALGAEWVVEKQPAPNSAYIGVQYLGSGGGRRMLPILFKGVPVVVNGNKLVRLDFLAYTVQ